jgi:hypothetical protein
VVWRWGCRHWERFRHLNRLAFGDPRGNAAPRKLVCADVHASALVPGTSSRHWLPGFERGRVAALNEPNDTFRCLMSSVPGLSRNIGLLQAVVP